MPFGLFDTEQRARDERSAFEPALPEEPGVFTGTGEGIGKGFMRGGARVAEAAGIAASAPFVAYDMVTGKRTADSIFNVTTMLVDPAMEYWTPAPSDVGMAGRVLGGFAEIGLPLMAGGGNPSLLASTMGLSEGAELVKAGASPEAAAAVGLIQAGTLGIGFKIPFLGRTLAQRIGFGLGSNAALGVGSRAASSVALGDAPANLRDRYDPLDTEAAIVDVVTGAVFGGVAHLGSPSVRDSALTLNAAKHLEVDSAPGKPLTDDARTAHVQAMEKATDQLMRGEPVNVSEQAPRLDFEPTTLKDKAVATFKKLVDDVAKVDLPAAAVAERTAELRRTGNVPATLAGTPLETSGGVRDPLLMERAKALDPDRMKAILAQETDEQVIKGVVRDILATEIGERLGGVSHLRGIITSLARTYMEQGPEAGRARLDDMAANARGDSGFADEVATPGFVDELDAALTRETDVLRAERRTGELLVESERNAGARGIGRSAVAAFDSTPPTLSDLGITRDQSSGNQAIADMPVAEFESGAARGAEGEEARPVGNPRREVERMEWEAAQQVADARPDLEVVGPDGDVMPAAELMRWADEMVQVAREDAAAITAAVECYLRS